MEAERDIQTFRMEKRPFEVSGRRCGDSGLAGIERIGVLQVLSDADYSITEFSRFQRECIQNDMHPSIHLI